MSDEEIEFLGTKPAVLPTLQRPVTGIVLHVEDNGNTDGYRLTFNRSSSSVIHVGRRPGAESESRTRDIDSGRAMFRCAVVSRKHAKIAFSDSGHVYLIDLSSHHGTHLRKSGELSSKTLQAEVPTALSDGDIITFGKTVGRHEESVRPVVVRIELLRTPPALVVPEPAPTSGRYGVYDSSSPSRPSTPTAASTSSVPYLGKAFDVLKRLIPPSHVPAGPSLAPIVAAPPLEYVPGDFSFASASFDSTFFSSSPPTLPPLRDVTWLEDEDRSRSNSPMDLESPPTSPQQMMIKLLDEEGEGEEDDDESESSESMQEEDEEFTPPPRDVVDIPPVAASVSEAESELQQLKKTMEGLQDDVIRLDAHRRKYRSRFNNNVRKLSEKLSVYDDRLSSLHAQYDTLAEKVETVTKIDMVDTECQLEEMSEQIENLAYVDVPDLQSQVDEIEREISDVKMKQIVDGDFETARNEERKRIVDEAEKEMSALKELVEQMKQMRETTEQQMADSLRSLKEVCEATVAEVKSQHAQTKEELIRSRLAILKDTGAASLKRKRDLEEAESTREALADMAVDPSPISSSSSSEDTSPPTPADTITLPSSLSASQDTHGYLLPDEDEDSPLLVVPDFGPSLKEEVEEEESLRPRKKRRTGGLKGVASVVAQTAGAVTLGAVATWSVLAFA